MRIDNPISDNAIITGSFTGSFKGDGSQLTGITAEWDGSHTGDASITGDLTVGNLITSGTVDGVDVSDLKLAVDLNTAKVGITTQQAADITANNAKISFDNVSSAKLAGIESGATNDTAALSSLDGRVTAVEGDVAAILSGSQADKDSFAEIVTLINSVDTTNDQAFAGYVISNNAAVAGNTADIATNTADIATNTSDIAANTTKLAGIEAGATGDQTAAEILAALITVDGAGSGLDADLLDGQSSAYYATATSVAANTTKLAGIESGATADQTAAEIKTAYESNADTNAFDDAAVAKLAGIESGATGDQTAAEILAALKTVDGSGSGLDADLLDGQSSAYYGTAAAVALNTAKISFDSESSAKLAGIESGATADQTAAEILTAIKTVDGAGSGLDADLLDGQSSAYYATATSLSTHIGDTANPHSVTKAQVGLGSVDNTSDAAKPVSTAQQTALDLKANLASPTFTGTVAVPTPLTSDDSTKAASTAYVNAKIQSVIDAAPAALDTLNELAAAIGDDSNFAGTVTTALGEKLVKASNLSDLTNVSTARTNLGLGTAATTAATAYATAAQGTKADTAFGWGNHASAGYLTSYTDTNTTYTAGNGLTLTGTSFSHTDTSSQATVTNSGRTYIQGITLDTYGHITGITSATETVINTDTTYSVGDGGLTEKNFTSALKTKLDGIATGATNVTNNNQLVNGAGYQTTSGTVAKIEKTVAGGSTADLVYGNMADNDQFRIQIGGATNAGWAEIATADDGTEPIYVRQYTGVFTSLIRTATLLDGSGNTSFPGSITAGSDIVAYSDERLKKDVKTIEGALAKTNSLRGVEFTRISDDSRSIGVIAQELEAVLPELVITDAEGMKGVNYAQITGLLIEAIKELSAKVEELTK